MNRQNVATEQYASQSKRAHVSSLVKSSQCCMRGDSTVNPVTSIARPTRRSGGDMSPCGTGVRESWRSTHRCGQNRRRVRDQTKPCSAFPSCGLASAVFFERDSSALVMRPEHEQHKHSCARLGVGASSERARARVRLATECKCVCPLFLRASTVGSDRSAGRTATTWTSRMGFPAVGSAGSGAGNPQRRCRGLDLETAKGRGDAGRRRQPFAHSSRDYVRFHVWSQLRRVRGEYKLLRLVIFPTHPLPAPSPFPVSSVCPRPPSRPLLPSDTLVHARTRLATRSTPIRPRSPSCAESSRTAATSRRR